MESGLVGIRISNVDGNSKMLRTVDAGQTFGCADFFAGKGYRASAYCLKEATICQVPGDTLKRSLQHNAALGLAFLSHSAEDLELANAATVQQALYPVRTRLAHLLLGFKDNHGASREDGVIVLELPVSWQEAAELVGARPESVSRSVHALVRDKVISTNGRRVEIHDLDLLLDELEARVE